MTGGEGSVIRVAHIGEGGGGGAGEMLEGGSQLSYWRLWVSLCLVM